MAGGSGTRFWPMSRQAQPKQLLKIIGDQTMLQITVDRLSKCKKTEAVYISTRKDLNTVIKKEIKGVLPKNIIAEPSGKNTAPCIGLSALHISKIDNEAVMGIFPADHLIVGHRAFEKALNHASKVAVEREALVTIGIQPTFPSTAYGYIQYDPDKKVDKLDAYPVRTFAEKPHLNTAKRFIKSKDFLWNAGIFIWKIDVFLEELGQHMPELSEQLQKIRKRIKSRKSFADIWTEIVPESIDYGLLEKTKNIYVIKSDFRWNDLGSWNAVYDVLPKRKDGNLVKGGGVVIDGNNNFIQNNDHFTAVVGLDNVVVISTEDATLVVNKDNVEDVRKAVDFLIEKERQDLL
jgi:mannose-1-phosphate guanylyltransferase|tara:strand:- start:5724 stop:6767 length:1044 start_codon:yes stop_codon:yes gene_type:complete